MIRIFFLVIVASSLYSSQQEAIKKSNELKLYERNEWKALLHFKNNLNIKDKNFIKSIDNFSLNNEMQKTIEGFFESKNKYENKNLHMQCKFPARFLFIKKELSLNDNDFPKVFCEDFEQYKINAPFDEIYLAYASDNVKNPYSMMGHTFLKFKGLKDKNLIKEHSISFYALMESANPIKILYQNIYSGMNGVFVLRPYQETLDKYLYEEERSVFEYKLNVNDYQRNLFAYHIWELKDIEMKYFFTSYNCATALFYSLSLINPMVYNDEKIWITPLDLIKYLYKYNFVSNSTLIPNQDLQLKFQDEKYKDNTNLENYLNIKSPNKIPDEKQFTFSYNRISNNNYAKISFLPGSHLQRDDNRNYFDESELKLFYLSALLNKNNFLLEEFTPYSMKSFSPYNGSFSDLSYEFGIMLKKDYDTKMNYSNNFKLDFSIGYDFNFLNDIDFYFLLNSGINYNKEDKTKILLSPKLGLIIYEIFGMKSVINYNRLYFENKKVYDKYSFTQSIFLTKNKKIFINLEKYKGVDELLNIEVGIGFNF